MYLNLCCENESALHLHCQPLSEQTWPSCIIISSVDTFTSDSFRQLRKHYNEVGFGNHHFTPKQYEEEVAAHPSPNKIISCKHSLKHRETENKIKKKNYTLSITAIKLKHQDRISQATGSEMWGIECHRFVCHYKQCSGLMKWWCTQQ